MSLTEKQRRFVEAYVLDPNGKKAAVAAGYSASGAEVTASKLLRHPKVSEELEKRRKLLQVRSGVTPEMVVAELARLGFADIRHVLQWRSVDRNLFTESGDPANVDGVVVSIKNSGDISSDAAAAIAEVAQAKDGSLKVKMHDKLGALVRIGQHLGMFRAASEPRDEPLGKKEQAAANADTAAHGTSWDGLLQ